VIHSPVAGPNGRDKISVDITESLYAKRRKIYPREVHGVFAQLRVLGVVVLLGLFYGAPWMVWEGEPLLLFDLPARKFYIFGMIFWPQDFFYLTMLLVLAALSLFFFTALAGRLWCGIACPQTVWTEVFLWIERKIEGDRQKQIRLDKSPLSIEKVFVKGSKHLVWVLLSAWTGITFVGYFTPISELIAKLTSFGLGPWETFWIVFYGFATYGNAGWLREQVCIYMCPYARFQSAMFDKNTLIISYNKSRGEPRGSRRRDSDYRAKGLGDCVDCTLCVQACPTGIDIRDGLQYQCIGCAACIDACNDVMDKVGYAKGLISYTTENAQLGRSTRVLRPRVIIYAVILLSLMAGFAYSLSQRTPLELDVIRDRNALYRETNEGLIQNVYTLKIINMDKQAHQYELNVSGISGLKLPTDVRRISVDAGAILELPIRLPAEANMLQAQSTEIVFHLKSMGLRQVESSEVARFVGPLPRK